MKVRFEQITDDEEEVIIRYRQMTRAVQDIAELLSRHQDKIPDHDSRGNRSSFG